MRAGIVILEGLQATVLPLVDVPDAEDAPTSFIWPAAHRPGIIEVIEDDARPVTDVIFTIQTENSRAGIPRTPSQTNIPRE